MLESRGESVTRLADAPSGYVAAMADLRPERQAIWIVSSDGKVCRYDSERKSLDGRVGVPERVRCGGDVRLPPVRSGSTRPATRPSTRRRSRRHEPVTQHLELPNHRPTGEGGPVLVADPSRRCSIRSIAAWSGRSTRAPASGGTPERWP